MKKLLPQRLVLVLNAITIVFLLVVLIPGVANAAPQISDQNQGQSKKQTGIAPLNSQKFSKSFGGFQQSKPSVASDIAKSHNENSKPDPSVGPKPANLEAVQEIESIRQLLGIAIFPDQKGSSEFKAQVGKLMSEDAKASAQIPGFQNPLLTPPKVRKATQADFSPNPKTTVQKNTKPKTPGQHAKFFNTPAFKGEISYPSHQNVGPQVPPMIQTRANSAPWPIKQAEYTPGNPRPVVVYGTPTLSPLNVESKVQQTINVLYDSVGELDRTALAFERAGENARADVFRQLSKTLREQIVETKLMLEDADKATAKDSGILVD